MKITNIIHHAPEELISSLRKVTMLLAPEVYPYEKAFISLEKIRLDYIWPTQRYVLRSELEKIRALRWFLQERGYDLFNLEGYLTIEIDEEPYRFDLLPPIVEESVEKDGSLLAIINDGMHRLYLAWQEWVVPQVVYVRGIPKNLPYYAFPLKGGWSAIELIEDVEDLGILKKFHRIRENKKLYRNFNSAFLNVGGPRGRITV